MNKQIIINISLIFAVIICATVAIVISHNTSQSNKHYIDPDSKQEKTVVTEQRDKHSRATRMIISVDSSIFDDGGLAPNEYEVLVTALTTYNKDKLNSRYKEGAINTSSFSKNGNHFTFEVRLGGPDSNERRNISITRINENTISLSIKTGDKVEFEQTDISISKTVRYGELRQ